MAPNPWTNLVSENNNFYANVDQDAIFAYIKKNYPNLFNDLRLDLYPEPFIGNPDANIYLLNGNPGCGQEEIQFVQNSGKFRAAIEENLKLKATSFLYLDEEVCTYDNNKHPGYNWWKSHLKQLSKAIGGKSPEIFNIEYFPYHSKNLDNVKSWIKGKKYNPLPSGNFSNELIKKAMDAGKIIVIMRLKNAWYNRLPDLKTYSNLIELRNPQNVSITSDNVKVFVEDQKKSADNWDKLLKNA